MKNIVLGAVAVVVTILGVSFVGKPTVNVTTPAPVVNVAVPEQKAPVVNVSAPSVSVPTTVNVPKQELSQISGSVSGPDVFAHSYFNEGLTKGGYIATSSTAATYTTNQKDFTRTPTYIAWTPNIVTTVSLSSTSTLQYVPKLGDTATIYIKNASTTSGTITFAAVDANVDLLTSTSTLSISAGRVARLTFIKTGTYSIAAIFESLVAGD